MKQEYKCLLKAITSPAWTCTDAIRQSVGQGKFNPVTFADAFIDSNGKKTPVAGELYDDEDRMA